MGQWVDGRNKGQAVFGKAKLGPQGTKIDAHQEKLALLLKIRPLATRISQALVFLAKGACVCVCFFLVACMKGPLSHSLLVSFACGWALETALSALYYLVWFVLYVCYSKMVPSLVVKLLT